MFSLKKIRTKTGLTEERSRGYNDMYGLPVKNLFMKNKKQTDSAAGRILADAAESSSGSNVRRYILANKDRVMDCCREFQDSDP